MIRIFSFILLLSAMSGYAQKLNKKTEDPNRHVQILINFCDREGLTSFPEFKASYDAFYDAYKPDSALVPELSKLLKDKKITIVLGTWCGDSKYQVPGFLKVTDAVQLPAKNMEFIAVDGTKKAENGIIDKLKIERVPTIIISDKKGKELGRIVEHPKETLEKDLLKILTEK